MNIQIAKNRVHQVINVDSINNEAYDFMATHIPFRNITYRTGVNVGKKESISETEVFYKIFEDSLIADKHQLIIVEGSSGSGKSHFIRWLYTNLLAKGGDKADEVLLIRRSENTLKGTIKQLLGIEAVKNLKNKDIYERLVKANTTISDVKFKEEIFAKFIVEINVSEDDDTLTSLERKRLVALLNNDSYKSKIMELDGPIERIFSKISNTGVANIDIVAEFRKEDFVISTEFFDEMRDLADQRAVSIAKRLVSDDLDEELLERITLFMNSKVEDVIQSCAGIEPGDFQQIFKEIRQELFNQGKNLVLLIEDITSFTGINQALLNALVTEHTGLHASEKMCKLISVVGTTDQYYKTFRDNYKDRISSQVTIEDGAIGQNKADLQLFFAKYLNTVSLTVEELEDWRVKTGAAEEELPVHSPDVEGWEAVTYNAKSLSLYPFTKKAIENLYNYMEEHKTPRYILLEIIKPAIDELTTNKSMFMKFLKNRAKPDLGFAVSRITDTVNNLNVPNVEDYLKRAIAFISFWGNGSLTKNGNKLAGISKTIFTEFGFAKLWDALINSVDETGEEQPGAVINEPIISDPKVEKKTNKRYDEFKVLLDNWYHKKAIYADARYIREELSEFVYSTINWQQYGISNNRIKFIRESGYSSNFISFERQGKGADKGLILLDDSNETYKVLQAIGQWLYLGNKSWNFDGSYNAIYILTNWLECRKEQIIGVVKNFKDGEVPNYIKIAMVALIHEKILKKQIQCSKIEDITIDDIIKLPTSNTYIASQSEKWNNLIALTKSGIENYMYNIVMDYFSLAQGSKDGGHRFLDYYTLEKIFIWIKKNKFELSEELLERTSYTRENEVIEYYNKFVKKVPALIDDEEGRIRSIVKNIYDKFGWELSDEISVMDLRELLDEITDFYKKAEQIGFLANSKQSEIENYKNEANGIAKNILKITRMGNSSVVERLLALSNSDTILVMQFSDFLSSAGQDVDRLYPLLECEMVTLTKQGKWVEEDPRFAQNEFLKNACVSVVEE